MCKVLTIALTTISLTFGLLATRFAESAQASYTCGPHLRTYSVRSLNGVSGRGVRCVMRNGGAWFGEGYWGNVTYRHVGEKLGNQGYAGDIYGNGEVARGSFLKRGDLRFSGSWQDNNPSRRIRVTGAWNEEWILETDNTVQDYTSPLGAVNTCGPNFSQFRVSPGPGGGNVFFKGIRCVLFQLVSDGNLGGNVWYGEGVWGGTTYAHIGEVVSFDRVYYGAFDICEPSKFVACGAADFGRLTVRDINGNHLTVGDPYTDRVVTGAWNEIWTRE